MNRSTAAGSFFFPVVSVITEISDACDRMSSAAIALRPAYRAVYLPKNVPENGN
jgi:hypothetical protein